MERFQKLYAAMEKFDPSNGTGWHNYIEWSGLFQLTEVVGLDGMLNEIVLSEVKDHYWEKIVNEDFMLHFFTDLNFMLAQIDDVRNLNVIGTIKAPAEDVSGLVWDGFTFCGYELLDQDHDISALTNCGGFPDVFRNDELSSQGLVLDFGRATQIRHDLQQLYPEERHADCNIWAVFRRQG
ncbi:MAG TPA: hypothetical protein VGV39_03320 [Mesorhizobium sp.]|jgi:hypothetical protein|uniref:hypothetical protein n=1 Tax=Mesorhizobium sp. TaxID=1871066 RepID=UPI002DDD3C2D|nr:hypothetical protein [Mesorhizobium sp.]HEV2502075.1 hypothetical protein [Mesorhizobium sp.]